MGNVNLDLHLTLVVDPEGQIHGAEGAMRFLLYRMVNTRPEFSATGSCFLQQCFGMSSKHSTDELVATRSIIRKRKDKNVNEEDPMKAIV
ncbi:hypothetical protein CTI12_AA028870 [Artemisia annua]|uniref:Uncharacterized protein n=1 Tax=Artemisia annua TaxID=35608 RepID=A0A2U1QHM2_ARTAN|nr:hypothetical protein CTI12_AA028870 [Artemisia annua]